MSYPTPDGLSTNIMISLKDYGFRSAGCDAVRVVSLLTGILLRLKTYVYNSGVVASFCHIVLNNERHPLLATLRRTLCLDLNR